MTEFNFFTPINMTGYGVVGENIVRALIEEKYSFNLFPVSNPDTKNISIKNKIEQDGANFISYIPSVYHWHAHDLHSFAGNPRIGFTVFELDAFTNREINEIENCEHIIVPTKWAKNIVINQTSNIDKDNVHVLNFGCDLSKYHYHQKNYNNLTSDRIKLLNVGKFEVRKGHYNLAEALAKMKNNNVDLIAHWFNPFIKIDIIVKYLFGLGYKLNKPQPVIFKEVQGFEFIEFEASNGNRIFLSVKYNPDFYVVNELSKICHLGVYPARAEGWNLPLHESMACGLPCIVTNYSGHTEYVNKDNSILMDIDYTRLIRANDGMFFRGTHGSWLYYTTQDLINIIDSTIDNISNLDTIHNNLKNFREKYTWNKTAQQLIEIVRSTQITPF